MSAPNVVLFVCRTSASMAAASWAGLRLPRMIGVFAGERQCFRLHAGDAFDGFLRDH
jgi:hypothetical protein